MRPELVTLTVDVADVQQTQVRGRAGGITALLAVKGDAQVGVDIRGRREIFQLVKPPFVDTSVRES